jgi:hypothetical protein
MTFRLAIRALATRPVRTAVLACGFGFGISVMAALLGVGEVILEQARAPALQGGGDVVILGANGTVPSARYVRSTLLGAPVLASQVRASSPSLSTALYLVRQGTTVRVVARGGVPSLERAIGDPETAREPLWQDSPLDVPWASPDPTDLLRAMDRFHPIPEAGLGKSAAVWGSSWAEWLYFNGRTADGATRFYLTFLVGTRSGSDRRGAGVRLQLEHGGLTRVYAARADVGERDLLRDAPDLSIGNCRVRLEDLRYFLHLELSAIDGGPSLAGDLSLTASPGRSMPPFAIRGADGWVSGYVVPVLSGILDGDLRVETEHIAFQRAAGYHDHNWGFWRDVSWQWGQVSKEGMACVYGRVRAPAEIADADRIPGFLAVLGPDGPLGFSTDVSIAERYGSDGSDRSDRSDGSAGASAGDRGDPGSPHPTSPASILVRARGAALDLRIETTIEAAISTPMGGGPFAASHEPLAFIQMRGTSRVSGRLAGREIDFSAPASAETFRGE